jgi:hypothetical protein
MPPTGGWVNAINNAIQRLEDGQPTDTRLLRLARLGRLRIGPSTVAIEAGCPRDYISHETCRFPDLYLEIKALRHPVAKPRSLPDVSLKVRQRNKELLDSSRVARLKLMEVITWAEDKAKEYDQKLGELNRLGKHSPEV